MAGLEMPVVSGAEEKSDGKDDLVEEPQTPVASAERAMGVVQLTLDRGVKTTVVGTLYGLDFEIEGEGFRTRVYFDNYSRRLKVLDYEASDYRALAERLSWLASANSFDKIFLKARREDWRRFLGLGFMLEGILKYFFSGEDAFVLSKFGTVERITSPHLIEESQLIERIMREEPTAREVALPEGYRMVQARGEHIEGLVALYRAVFETYPSPLTQRDYIAQTMERDVLYRCVVDAGGRVVSAASAEIDRKHANAELTDCATLKSERGKGLVHLLLRALQDDLVGRNIVTAYTLARARSAAMNWVFYRLGFEYSGRLLNNCDIYGAYEDMNIWVRRLDPSC